LLILYIYYSLFLVVWNVRTDDVTAWVGFELSLCGHVRRCIVGSTFLLIMKYILSFILSVMVLGLGLFVAGAKIDCSADIWVLRLFALCYFTFFSSLSEAAAKLLKNVQR